MNSEQLHDILMIWLLRRLDLGDARREIDTTYDDLFENHYPQLKGKSKKHKKEIKSRTKYHLTK